MVAVAKVYMQKDLEVRLVNLDQEYMVLTLKDTLLQLQQMALIARDAKH